MVLSAGQSARQTRGRLPQMVNDSIRIALCTVNTLGACQYYLTRLQSTCPRVQNHYKGLFVAKTASRFRWLSGLVRWFGIQSVGVRFLMHACFFCFFCRKFKFLANCSTILSEGQRPCLERRSRRSLGLSRAEGPVGHVRRILAR